MKSPILVIVLLVLSQTVCSAYTVVLKTGERIEGSYITEDDEMIWLKNKSGYVINLKKDKVDDQETALANYRPGDTGITKPQPDWKAAPRSVADIAREERKKTQKTGPPKRVYTNKDVAPAPAPGHPVVIVDVDTPPENGNQQPQTEPATIEAIEREWKEKTMTFVDRISKVRAEADRLQRNCNASLLAVIERQPSFTVEESDGRKVDIPCPVEDWDARAVPNYRYCEEASQAEERYKALLQEFEDFKERARREGALPGWIDPDRF